jgi:regulator of replication initiation timing
MNEQDYKRNIGILRDKADDLRAENQRLSAENLSLNATLSEFRKNMLTIEAASKNLEKTYKDTVYAYEAELTHQAEINKSLHYDVKQVQESLATFQSSFIGRIVLFFTGIRRS